MSAKSNMTNSIRSGSGSLRQNSLHEKLHPTPSNEEKVMLAAEESKDRLYEPKRDKKMVRVLTVVVYVFSVSLAAIMLSLYYVFFWEPKGPHYVKPKVSPYSTSNLNITGAGAALTPPLPSCLPLSELSHPAISTPPTAHAPETETAPAPDNSTAAGYSTEDSTQPVTYEDDDNNNIVPSEQTTVASRKKRRREDPV